MYVQTFVLTPCLAFITWTRTSEQNPHGRRLTSKAQAHSEDGLDQGFGQLGHLTVPSLSGSHPQAWPAVLSPRAFKEAMEPSMVTQAVGWSEDRRWGAAFTWGTTDLTSRVTQCGHHSVHYSLSGGGHPWHRLPLVAEQELRTAQGRRGRGLSLHIPGNSLGTSRVGLLSLRLLSLPGHLDRWPWVWD